MNRLEVETGPAAEESFRVWARGETGYPLVDAAMRQLLREGWIHNRSSRMVAASFLVKHLHLDWRWGARWFMWRLIDGDVASNQHGWQWTAGCPARTRPPITASSTRPCRLTALTPAGEYVRHYVSELAQTPAPDRLEPGAGGSLLAAGYPGR
jgi:deoxyribodipyrimidine photo-lyase